MKSLNFQFALSADGITLTLVESEKPFFGRQRERVLDKKSWLTTPELHAISALAFIESRCEEANDGTQALSNGSGYHLSHATVSAFTDAQALSVGLPTPVPYSLRLSLNGALTANATKVLATWHNASGKRVQLQESGAIATDGKNHYRLPSGLFQVLLAVDTFNAWDGSSLDERLALASMLKARLKQYFGAAIELDKQIDDLNLMHASSLSLDLRVTRNGIDFDPVLFSSEVTSKWADGELIEEEKQVVKPELQAAFRSLFKASDDVKATYVVERNQYVFIDPALRPTIQVIRDAQKLPPAERANFAKSPQSFIKQKLLDDGHDDETADELVTSSFIETDQFSARVLEVGLWSPPVLPFIQRQANTWIPEGFGLKIGTKSYNIPELNIKQTAELIADAMKHNTPTVTIACCEDPLPANQGVLDALNSILSFLKEQPVDITDDIEPDDATDPEPTPPKNPTGKSVLIVHDNFLESGFTAKFKHRATTVAFQMPDGMLSQPKAHQVEGLEWLRSCWVKGFPGCLLADDMGLGKTFQVLVFLKWLKDFSIATGSPIKPILIVAPTTLLGNWEREAAIHLEAAALGGTTLLYGSALRKLRLPGMTTNDVVAGKQTLDVDTLMNSGLVLTTYETMRDHHISLASLPFSCIVFDEMQKIKSPTSMMTHAAQALNADFQIGMTGTPIENSLADIWTLFDTLMPGGMGWGDLRQFMAMYRDASADKLIALKATLQIGKGDMPAPMLRRMKTEVAKDLPEKYQHIIDTQMPVEQASPYHAAVLLGKKAAKPGDRMTAFQAIRGLSLHPYYPDAEEARDGATYINNSARLRSTIEILDKVHVSNEKALVFVESRAMHEWLAFYLKQRYQLAKTPYRIFGAIASSVRTQIVDDFQDPSKTGKFDVLLLSPKAAGVGLTLTAATHVIHLTRWWNPAVEDQCTDRAYRIGQTRAVHVHIPRSIHPLYGEGSFDCILHNLLEKKRTVSEEMLVPMEDGKELDQIYEAMGMHANGESDDETITT